MDQNGFDLMKSTLEDNTISDVSKDLEDLIKVYGLDATNTIYNELKKRDSYRKRFAGNVKLVEQGYAPLSEYEYIQTEKDMEETFSSYGAKDLASRETKANLIANRVSNKELSDRFSVVQNRINNAYKSNDLFLINQLKDMYPGINDADIMKSMILGKDGSDYLKNRLNVADIKAAQEQTGIKSALGAEYLAQQGVTREQALSGLSTAKEATQSAMSAATAYGENISADETQKQLERESIFGAQSSGKTKRLASQVRGEFGGASGIQSGSLKTTKQGSL